MKRMWLLLGSLWLLPLGAVAQQEQEISDWQMQDASKVTATAATVITDSYNPAGWFKGVVPGTVLTTLVANYVYPEPL